MNTVFVFRQTKAAGLPDSYLLGNLPSPVLPAWPPLAEALQTHAVTPLPGAHATALFRPPLLTEWPYVALLVGLVVMVAAALHLLSAWVAYVIFAVLWIGFAIGPKGHR